MTNPHELPHFIQQQIDERGASAVLDEVFYREQINRDEMLFWKRIRAGIEATIQSQLDEFSTIAEDAFNADD